MQTVEIIIIMTGNSIMIGLFSYQLGKYCERKAWNDLINNGIIPKPSKKG